MASIASSADGTPPTTQPAGSNPPVLLARDLRVTRGGREILRGVTVSVHPGEVLGVLGPSGAGKSTLFRTLVGETPPDAGRVEFQGKDVTGKPLWARAREGIGYVPQGPSVLWDLTVRANLETFRRVAGLPAGASGHAAAQVGLEQRLDVQAGELSGGERRRLELARAITRTPKVLVCDEPFAGVDPAGAERLGCLLRDLAQAGTAIVLADHHVDEALRVCTHAVLLLDGVVVATTAASEFAQHPVVRGRYLGTFHA